MQQFNVDLSDATEVTTIVEEMIEHAKRPLEERIEALLKEVDELQTKLMEK